MTIIKSGGLSPPHACYDMAVNAQTLNCPMCGAAARSDATRCEHCGARLATVACPSCFGLMFLGAKFCSHCGARAERAESDPKATRRCPRCRVKLEGVAVGASNLLECPKCEGIWADAASLEKICADREQQAAVLGMAASLPQESGDLENVRYVPCPVCNKLMNRVNFANCSHVVVDVCKGHGTWFDKDELRRIVEFIRAGGIEQARARQIAELQDQQRQLNVARMGGAWDNIERRRDDSGELELGISAAAGFLKHWLR